LKGGLVVYLFEEGRGTGLQAKFSSVRLQQTTGLDTSEAFDQLGLEPDPRDYTFPAEVVQSFLEKGQEVTLLTNNPTRRERLILAGLTVSSTQALIIRTPANEDYLAGKAKALGHEV